MNFVKQYREAISFYAVAAVVLTAVAISTDGNAQDGAPQPLPRAPTASPSPSETPTATSTLTPTPSVSSMPSVPPVTLPPSSPPPSIIIAVPTPTPTVPPTPTPSPMATVHNKAHGLKDGCLVQKKKWLLRVPCPQAHRTEETP